MRDANETEPARSGPGARKSVSASRTSPTPTASATGATDVATLRLPAPCSFSELRRRARPALKSAGAHRAVAFAGRKAGFGVFDALAREGVDVYRVGPSP